MEFENTLRYASFGDKSQVNKSDLYDSLMVPSHLLVGGKKKIPMLIRNLVEEGEVGYYIDPAITTFRVGDSFLNDNDELKEWHEKLIDWYGDPIEELIQRKENLDIRDVSDDEVLASIVENVIEFQEEFVSSTVSKEAGKYEAMAGEDIESDVGPLAVIPPYTLLDDDDAVSANKKSIEIAKNYADTRVKPCLHIDKSFLMEKSNRQDIIDMVNSVEVSEVFLWIDNLDKFDTDVGEYVNVISLVEGLSAEDISPHFIAGDYFVTLMYFFGASGTAYGTYHTDYKKEKTGDEPAGGYLRRYYVDELKEFFKVVAASEILQESDSSPCTCSVCTPRLVSWRDLIGYRKDHQFLKNHHMEIRKRHKQELKNKSLDDLMEKLEDAKKHFTPVMKSAGKRVKEERFTLDYLDRWIRSIKEYRNN